MGTIVSYEDIATDTILDAIHFALDPIAQKNAKLIAYSYVNRIQTPKETAVWWVEHVIKTRGAPLTKSHSTFMSIIEYHSLDVYALFLVVFLVTVASWIWVLRKICGKKSPEKLKTK